ncbi:MAG: DUF4127 family protein [bacterium]|nr:DUF4127 family protein [bacterium]
MKKIIYIPLDERPCNKEFPILLSKGTEYKILSPPKKYLGYKKTPADTESLFDWLISQSEDSDALILSLDMLLYGGIIPSRMHYLSFEKLFNRLQNISKLKKNNPSLKIYAFSLIMRCPKYSSNDEEPDYYSEYGKNIHHKKLIEHKIRLNIASESEIVYFNCIHIPNTVLTDFEFRREINKKINFETCRLLLDNVLDFLVIPQDDSAKYGYTAIDQTEIKDFIKNKGLLNKVLMYPGADEVGCTLVSRYICDDNKYRPQIYVSYPTDISANIIPLYEDRTFAETVQCHITAAGGISTCDKDAADIFLMVNAPDREMREAKDQKYNSHTSDTYKNLLKFCCNIEKAVNNGKVLVIADSAYANGGDLRLFNILKEKNLLFKITGYAGWNTNGNTLGTAISEGIIKKFCTDSKASTEFMVLRYLEDVAYCSSIRWKITEQILPKTKFDYFQLDGQRGKISELICNELSDFLNKNIKHSKYKFKIKDCYMPWNRMFEIGIQVEALTK